MALKATKNGSEQPKQRLFFRRTLKGVYLDFLFTGGIGTFTNLLMWFGKNHVISGPLAVSPMVYLPMLLLGISIVAYCFNYSILIKEARIKGQFKTFFWGFFMNVLFFVLNLLLWIIF